MNQRDLCTMAYLCIVDIISYLVNPIQNNFYH